MLKPGKKLEKPYRIIFFDSEARVNTEITDEEITIANSEMVIKEHEPYLISACFYDVGSGKEVWKDYYGEGFRERFWNDVANFTPKGKKVWMFTHNAKYDVLLTGCVPALVDRGYTVESFSDANPFFLRLEIQLPVLDEEGNQKFIEVEEGDNIPLTTTDRTLLILSSTNYFAFALAKLGETFGIPKMDMQHDNPTIEEAIPYCKNDVLILKTAVLAFIDLVQEHGLGNLAMTLAGQAFSAYKHRFMPEETIYIHTRENAIEVERESYAGGRTECFRIGEINEPVYYVDVNSMYPYVMKNEKSPVKYLTFREYLDVDGLNDFIEWGYLLTARCKVETDIPIFHKKMGRLVFPIGRYWTTLTTPEIIEGLKRGIIKEAEKVAVYEADYIFTDYVDFFYIERLKAKSLHCKRCEYYPNLELEKGEEPTKTCKHCGQELQIDAVYDLLFKLFMNALYGKWAQRNEHWEKIGEANPKDIYAEFIYDVDEDRHFMVKVFGGGVFRKNDDAEFSEGYDSFPAVAAHVTAHARLLLWSYAETAGLDNVFYMDTDSLFCNEQGYKNLEKAGLLNEKELGKLKLEKKSDKMRIYGLKDYEFDGTVKVKGVSLKKNAPTRKLSNNTFAVVQWPGFGQMLRKGKLSGYSNHVIIKKLKREYNKGSVIGGKVYPFSLTEW